MEFGMFHEFPAQLDAVPPAPGNLAVDSARRSGGPAAEQRVRRAERLRNLSYEDALRGQVLVGSPDGFADRRREVDEEIGLDGILAELNCGGRIPHERTRSA
jgi:hypothetical protein